MIRLIKALTEVEIDTRISSFSEIDYSPETVRKQARPQIQYIALNITANSENRETSHQQEAAQRRLRKVVITSLCFVRF